MLGDHRPPGGGFSRRFAPGSPELSAIQHEVWDDNNLGNAILGAMPRARVALRGVPLEAPILTAPGAPVRLDARVRNLAQRPWPAQATYGRRAVRLGAQLARDGHVVDRDFARSALRKEITGADGEGLKIVIEYANSPTKTTGLPPGTNED